MLHVLRRPSTLTFATAATAIYAVAIGLVALLPRLRHPDVVATAVLVDLTIVVPILFAILVRRSRSWAGIVPVFLLSLLGARLVLPESARAVLPALRLLALPAELATLLFVLWRIRGAMGGLAAEFDVVARLERAIAPAVPNRRLAELLAYELGVIYYGLLSWRDRPAPEAGRTFSYHRAGGYAAIVSALLIVSACEIVGAHMLVSLASSTAAWLLTAISLYGVVWIVGDYQAVRLRPLLVGTDGLAVRLGLRWSVWIPRDAIAAIVPAPKRPASKRAPGHLHAALLVSPQWHVNLREPLVARGPYGITKRVTTVALAADDRTALRQALIECGLLFPLGTGGPSGIHALQLG
jgi:hypothetical protein